MEIVEKENFEKDLQNFKEFCDKRKFNFLVVGSLALKTCGIELNRDIHDVDIEVLDSGNQEEITTFKALSDAFTEKMEIREYEDTNLFVFKFGKSLFNVWVVKNFSHNSFVEKEGIKYAGVTSVLRKKMNYKRVKDYVDFVNIIANLTKITNGTV